MSTDLEQRIAAMATTWEREAPPISLAELRGRPAPELTGIEALIEVEPRPSHRSGRRVLALAAALLVAVGGAAVLARRSPERVDPLSPASPTPPPVTTAVTASTAAPATSEVPGVAPSTSSLPAALTADEVSERLAAIDAERRDALRAFTTIGFTVVRTQILPDGSAYDPGGPPPGPARVVVRNDGSSAVVSDSFGISYYDAVSGTARAAFPDVAGVTTYQQIDGQADGSVALGVTTGLANGIVSRIDDLSRDVVAIEEDIVDGRATWRIDQRTEMGIGPAEGIETSTWIDRATGITLQTTSSGAMFIGDGDGEEMIAIAETITLSELVPDEPMPAGFPSPFPPDAAVDLSGDPTHFGPITIDAASAELGTGAVVPTLPADQVSLQRMPFGTGDGGTEVTPSLIVRWFDGFLVTELRIDRLPSSMQVPGTSVELGQSLLEQLRAAPVTVSGVRAAVDPFQVWITGDPVRVRAIVDSLVTVS